MFYALCCLLLLSNLFENINKYQCTNRAKVFYLVFVIFGTIIINLFLNYKFKVVNKYIFKLSKFQRVGDIIGVMHNNFTALNLTNCFCCHKKIQLLKIYFLDVCASNLFGHCAAVHNQLVWQALWLLLQIF